MDIPHPRLVLDLFERLSGDSALWRSLRPAGAAFSRRRIYTLGVVVRLMMLQRLLPGGTLSRAVQQLLQSQAEPKKLISPRAGAYCRARHKLPTLVAIQVFELIVERLRGWLPCNPVLPARPVFVLDGTTLTLPHAPALVKAYPPSRNQHGLSHWPIIRLVVLQDVQTGLALRPHWGPHPGSQAVGEQQLALEAIPHLPEQAVVLGDRNFGVFAVAWAAARHHRDVLVRLTRPRAEALAGGPLAAPCEQNICWKPTRFDRCGGPFSEDAAASGRLVCVAADPSAQEELLYFFTTLDLPADALGSLYRLRWNVETDLRSIKQTVRLQQLSARSPDTLEKELLLALTAHNLVRAVICLAAEKAQVPPRRLSFTNVYTLVETFLPDLTAARTPRQWDDCWQRIISLATAYLLPQRTKPRSYPRSVWHRTPRHSRK
jgi:hypothetical protein